MEENLDKALSTALQAATPQKELPSSIKASAPDMDNMGKAAFEYLREAKEHLRQGGGLSMEKPWRIWRKFW